MNQKELNREVAKWEKAINGIKNNNRQQFIDLVCIGGGDWIYAKECTNAQAITQCKLAIDQIKNVSMMYV